MVDRRLRVGLAAALLVATAALILSGHPALALLLIALEIGLIIVQAGHREGRSPAAARTPQAAGSRWTEPVNKKAWFAGGLVGTALCSGVVYLVAVALGGGLAWGYLAAMVAFVPFYVGLVALAKRRGW